MRCGRAWLRNGNPLATSLEQLDKAPEHRRSAQRLIRVLPWRMAVAGRTEELVRAAYSGRFGGSLSEFSV
jgi:hypothetical protein